MADETAKEMLEDGASTTIYTTTAADLMRRKHQRSPSDSIGSF